MNPFCLEFKNISGRYSTNLTSESFRSIVSFRRRLMMDLLERTFGVVAARRRRLMRVRNIAGVLSIQKNI